MLRLFKLVLVLIPLLLLSFTNPDFETSMRRHGLSNAAFDKAIDKRFDKRKYLEKHRKSSRYPRYARYKAYKSLYDRNIQLAASETCIIPPIIHQIWIGSPVPECFKSLMKTWQDWPGWTYKLWTDEEVNQLPMVNREIYDKTKNFGEKADIVKLEILRIYGGIYVDLDFECLNPSFFNEGIKKWSFIAGFEPIDHNPEFYVGMAILAATPSHPMIEHLTQQLPISSRNPRNCLIDRTGPGFLTREINTNLWILSQTNGIVLPPTFLYPITHFEPEKIEFRRDPMPFISPETAGVHYWAGTWM